MRCKWLQILCICAVIQIQSSKANAYGPSSHDNRPTGNPTDGNAGYQGNGATARHTWPSSYDNRPTANPTAGNAGYQGNGATARHTWPSSHDNRPTGNPTAGNAGTQNEQYNQNGTSEHPNVENDPRRYICTVKTDGYDCQIQDVHLKNGGYYDFGLEDNQHQSLTFRDSTLEYLPKSLIDAFPNMKLLNLNELKITTIEPMAFGKATKLETVYLANNRLSTIQQGAFAGATELRMLVLSYNEINSFTYIFKSNEKLQHLYLEFNQLKSLPSFTYTPNLESLNASHNELDHISDRHFAKLEHLQTLDVSFNRLTQLNLQYIRGYLNKVDVSSNELTTLILPTFVEHLNARNNSLVEIGVSQNCILKTLDLANNKLKIQPNLATCGSMEYLDLSYNLLETFQYPTFMNNLQILKLRQNNLFDIDTPTKVSLPQQLRLLDLSYNKLSHGPSLAVFKKLEAAYFNDNNLISLKSYVDRTHTEFKGYRMSNNEWSCDEIEKFERHTKGNRSTTCASDMRNEKGICCRKYTRPYQDRLNELVNTAAFHERANREKCPKQTSTLDNMDTIESIRVQASKADGERGAKIQEISKVKINTEKLSVKLNQVKDNRKTLDKSKQDIGREIENNRKSYRVTKEGLISNKDMLERIVQFVQERKNFNDDLLLRREKETLDTNDLFGEKQQENTELQKNIVNLEQTSEKLKTEEKTKKKAKDLLEKQKNKNAASIHGTSGRISQ